MQSTDNEYRTALQPIEEKLLSFLRFFEKLQEEISFNNVTEVQERLQSATTDLFPQLTAALTALAPPETRKDYHDKLSEVIARFQGATAKVLNGRGRQFAEAFLAARQEYCQGLYRLYEIRAQLPGLQSYWVLPEALPALPTLETQVEGTEAPVGFTRKDRTGTHTAYTLYAPENYSPQQTWPLIVCLHGGYGHDDEYIWTWLRAAKSKGYLLLSPKSTGPTWSVLNPPVDVGSIRAMLDDICATYAVDRKRVYLSGLSDGGMFAYMLGLSCPDWFAGIAPIAGELHPMTDPMLRRKQGQDVPLFIVHGAEDFIFDVRSVRSSCELLQKIGYNVTYTELPEWGHAYTYSINEQLVMPWFESLGGTGQPA